MARTIGEYSQMDWTAMQSTTTCQPNNWQPEVGNPSYEEDMEEEVNPENIQMAEEAGLNMPPTQP
ncbi:hypothetical protein CRG98_024621 [Punica granatum]|uniref:Uncharacterized protein n=1 Tax=Punica granatum TaxID=22663 RepID=A0A2I0JFC1_PUNGR|nr:hypothetical protein CRG98_024621 [Punica granatum]